MWCIFIISSAAFPQLRKCDIIPRNEDQNEDTEPGGCGLRGMSGEGGVPSIAAQHSAPHRRSCRYFSSANIFFTICYWSVPIGYSSSEIGPSSNHIIQSQRRFCQNVSLGKSLTEIRHWATGLTWLWLQQADVSSANHLSIIFDLISQLVRKTLKTSIISSEKFNLQFNINSKKAEILRRLLMWQKSLKSDWPANPNLQNNVLVRWMRQFHDDIDRHVSNVWQLLA